MKMPRRRFAPDSPEARKTRVDLKRQKKQAENFRTNQQNREFDDLFNEQEKDMSDILHCYSSMHLSVPDLPWLKRIINGKVVAD